MKLTLKHKNLAVTLQFEADTFLTNPHPAMHIKDRQIMTLSKECNAKIFLTDVKNTGRPVTPQIEINYNSEEYELILTNKEVQQC